jgi:uncharacterized protein with FMN-binding domain
MKKLGFTILVGALLALLAGCGGLPAAETRTYLDSIPVANLSTLTADKAAGIYTGAYTIALPAGVLVACSTVKVDVTLDGGHQVTGIIITSPKELNDEKFGAKISSAVIAQQSLAIDGLSGSSYSSKAFLKAVENALAR